MKKCPYCQQEVQADAVKCRFCAEMLVREQKAPLSSEDVVFPNILPGYFLTGLCLLLELGIIFAPGFDIKRILSVGLFVFGLTGFIYWCVCVFKLHKALRVMSDGCYPISPAMAVGFGFIPVFNLYWMFKWPAEVLSFVKARSGEVKTWGLWVPGAVLFLSMAARKIDGALLFLLIFSVLSYLVQVLKKSLAVSPEATPYKSKVFGSPAATVTIILVCMIPILVLMAAIAIPNFIRARINANEAVAQMTLKRLSAELAQSSAVNGQRQILSGTKVSRGYRYSSKPNAGGYEILATPERCDSTGSKNLKVTNGGVISAEPCVVAASSKA